MTAVDPREAEFSDAWIDGDETARWRSASGLGPSNGASASGTSLLEYASADVVTRYEQNVQPSGDRERQPVE